MTEQTIEKRVFDFRMDAQSWFMIVGIFIAFWMVLLPATFGVAMDEVSTIRIILMSLVLTLLLICISCIPVILICYFIKRIPDIDYAVWVSTIIMILTILGVALN
jgi:hypothetical protein